MNDVLTKAAARNIFYGGTIFFFAIFILLVADSFREARLIEVTNPITAQVAAGKRVWERHACFDCHTLFGEGARFAPELGKVWLKYGGATDPDTARQALKGWFAAQPTGVEDRHQMPNFHLSDKDMDDVIAMLAWASRVNTQGWPPHAPK
ncbi:c-type cytochrome [Rhodopila globiformis]|uniref:Cytochrome C n=1 Tax=Rhodopila globiformis TaxID=1071 RepID=A0A2S6NN04_RHOGL|nr:cytochrome c [Rhodopila globiformis]PPQ38157.1 cytochrome C [Rhodopila globiformis]